MVNGVYVDYCDPVLTSMSPWGLDNGMSDEHIGTTQLLDAWYEGDQESLNVLLARHLETIRSMVRKRASAVLRVKEETNDLVDEAIIKFLRFGPKVRVPNEKALCSFLARVVQNTIYDRYDFYDAARRGGGKVVTLHTQDGDHKETPSLVLEEEEERTLIRVALEFLQPADREVIFLSRWEKKSLAEIGQVLGVSTEAAGQRFHRAMERLSIVARKLKNGQLDALLSTDVGQVGAS